MSLTGLILSSSPLDRGKLWSGTKRQSKLNLSSSVGTIRRGASFHKPTGLVTTVLFLFMALVFYKLFSSLFVQAPMIDTRALLLSPVRNMH